MNSLGKMLPESWRSFHEGFALGALDCYHSIAAISTGGTYDGAFEGLGG